MSNEFTDIIASMIGFTIIAFAVVFCLAFWIGLLYELFEYISKLLKGII